MELLFLLKLFMKPLGVFIISLNNLWSSLPSNSRTSSTSLVRKIEKPKNNCAKHYLIFAIYIRLNLFVNTHKKTCFWVWKEKTLCVIYFNLLPFPLLPSKPPKIRGDIQNCGALIFPSLPFSQGDFTNWISII